MGRAAINSAHIHSVIFPPVKIVVFSYFEQMILRENALTDKSKGREMIRG